MFFSDRMAYCHSSKYALPGNEEAEPAKRSLANNSSVYNQLCGLKGEGSDVHIEGFFSRPIKEFTGPGEEQIKYCRDISEVSSKIDLTSMIHKFESHKTSEHRQGSFYLHTNVLSAFFTKLEVVRNS
jgi:hypothetical protein